MRWWVFVSLSTLVYLAQGKPVKRKTKTQQTELIREKRNKIDDENDNSEEMQTFMLDLSTRDDMSRLKERFKKVDTRDVENDEQYRRLKRFSLHDEHDENAPSGNVAMEMRSSRSTKEQDDVTSFENSFSPEAIKKSTQEGKYSYQQNKRSNSFLLEALRKRNLDKMGGQPANEDNSGSRSLPEHSNDNENNKRNKISKEEENSEIFERTSNFKELESEPDGVEDTEEGAPDINTSDKSTPEIKDTGDGFSQVNVHHLVGGAWELVHHYNPRSITGSLTNTTIHSERNTTMRRDYIQNGISDEVKGYMEVEKSRRKPKLSDVRIIRSIEPEYETQEISAVYNEKGGGGDEEIAHVIAVNKRLIKSNGYIGCFIDQHPNRDLIKSYLIDDLTPQSCQGICKQKGHAYTGVQYGYQCHCGDNYGKYGHVPDKECNSVCGGDTSKKCGGFWRNAVYATEIDERDSEERETRSRIERVTPIQKSETPAQQDITVYLRSNLPEDPLLKKFSHTTEKPTSRLHKSHKTNSKASSKRNQIPRKTTAHSGTTSTPNQHAYLHPQNVARSFIPSEIVLKTFVPQTDKRSYTGSVKLKQSWHDDLKDVKSIKTKILAGNLESALTRMFENDEDFEKADVLGFREATIRDDPNTVHKVLVDFALTFKITANDKSEKFRQIVEDKNRLDDMPVFGDTLEIKEYKNPYIMKLSEHEGDKDIREVPIEEQFEGGADPFLQKVLQQI